uniref:Putative secreted protein n=1 Tax=Ixodes ricinus TaxID=34613 RepID=A0A6B0UA21_IXORI
MFFFASAEFCLFFNAFCKVFCLFTLPMHSRPHCTRIEKCIHFARVGGGCQTFYVGVGGAFITRGKKKVEILRADLGGAFITRVRSLCE